MANEWRAVLAIGFTSFTILGILIGAILADGRAGSASRTNDGGAWLINRAAGHIGHIDRVTREVSRIAGPYGGIFDVEQAPGVLLVNDPATGQVSLIDPARAAEQTALPLAASVSAAAAPDAVVLYDGGSGDVWQLPTDDFVQVTDLAAEPKTIEGSGPVSVVVGRTGLISVIDPEATMLRRVDGDGAIDEVSDPAFEDLAVESITAVGDVTVIASGSSLLVIDGEDVDTIEVGPAIAALQQPGGPARTVVAITEDGSVVDVDLTDGTVEQRLRIEGGDPLPPIVHEGCVHAVTASPSPVYHFCGRSEPLPGAGSELRLRLVNEWVWVNDANRGQIWFVTLDDLELQHISDWSSALPEDEEEARADGNTDGDQRDRFTPDGELPDELQNLDDDADNEDPVAEPDTAATRAGRSMVIDVLSNDRDDDHDPLVVASLGGEDRLVITGGVVSVTADGRAVQFVPEPGFTGETSFDYTVDDGRGGRDSATVTITVAERTEAGNQPPTTQVDNGTVRAGRSVSMNLLDNDWDADGDVLVLVDVVDDGTGIITFAPDGRLTYSPDITSPEGVLQLQYLVRDDFGAEASGTVRVRVRPPGSNQRPQARNDVVATVVGEIATLDVLANDADPDGDPLSVFNLTAVDPPGTVATLTPDGRFLFEPEEAGIYRFIYSASDGPESTPAQIRVDVEAAAQNRPPVPVVDHLALVIGDTRVVRVLDNDADPDGDVIGLVDWSPVDGLDIEEVPGVGFSVKALADAPRRVSFPYFISDGDGDPVASSVVVSSLAQEPVDYPPVAVADVIDVRPGQPTSIPVVANDHDPEGGPLSVAQPLAEIDEGFLQLGPEGQTLIITVDPGQLFAFVFGYDVEDEGGNRASSSVQVRIVPPDQPNRQPIAGPDSASTPAGTAVTVPVLANDHDPDGDPLIIEGIATQPGNGTVSINDDGTLVYQPTTGFSGTDRFTYTLADGYALGEPGRALGVVSVGVMPELPANRPPNAVDDDGIPPIEIGGQRVIIGVLTNDSDPDADPLTIVDVTTPPAGTVEVTSGAILFDPPDEADERQISFTYTIADGRGGSDQAVVTLDLVAAVEPEPPVAVNDQIGPHRAGVEVTFDPRTNDLDPDGSIAELVVEPSDDGSFTVNGDGSVSLIVPDLSTSLRYRVTDADGLSSEPGLINVVVTENLPPAVPPRAVSTAYNTPVDIDLHETVTDPDEDDLLFVLGANRQGGAVTVIGTPAVNRLSVRFTPDTDFEGQASFDFVVDDQQGHQVSSTVVVDVQPPANRPPVANSQTIDVDAGLDTPFDLSALVTDPDLTSGQDTLRFTVDAVSGPMGASSGPDGLVTITSALTDGGQGGSFDYTVFDSFDESASGTVTVNLTTVDFPPPVAVDDTGSDYQGNTVVVAALANDVESLPPTLQGGLVITEVGVTTGGTTSTDGQQVTFVPTPDFFGTTSFTYTIQDARSSAQYQTTANITIDVVGRPDAPAPPTLAPPGNGELTFNWTAPNDNGGPIIGYVVEYQADNGGTDSRTINSPSTNYTWTGLTNAVAYRFTVAAINEAGQGDFSSASLPGVPDIRPERPAPPGTPAFGDRQLTVSWSEPLSQGSPISDYEVEIGQGSAGTRAVGSAATTLVWDNLTNGTDHRFRVRARNAATNDNGGWSDWSDWSGPERPLTSPDAPAQPVAVRGDRQIAVSWTTPADGGDPITSYEIRQVGSASTISLPVGGGANQGYTWTDLSNGQPVSFEVRASNRDPSPGAWSQASVPVTPCSVPDAPTGLGATPGDRQMALSWTAPSDQGCAISGYRIVAQPGNVQQTAGPGATTHTFTGLTNGTNYTFTIAAINEVVTVDGLAPIPSAGISGVPFGLPIGPTLSSCANTGPRSVRCNWTTADGNGRPITDYQLQVGSSWQSVGTVTSFTYSAPANGASYSFRVRAVNEGGNGPASNQISVTTWDVPAAPNPSASASPGQVSSNWATPSNGGTALTAHQAKLTTGNCSAGGTTRNNPGSPETFTGLGTGTTYRVCVRYQNAVGWGSWGSSNTVTVPAPPRTASIRWDTYGGAQGEVGCSSAACTWVILTLSNYSPNTSYTFQCWSNEGGSWGSFWTGTVTTNGSGGYSAQRCYYGFVGSSVRLVVGGVTSNTITR